MLERVALLCPMLMLAWSSASAASDETDRITTCPNGGTIRGDAPPKGIEQWCEVGGTNRGSVRSGPWMAWYPSGALRARGEYVAGKRDGEWFVWSSSGVLVSSRVYLVGEIVGEHMGEEKDAFGETSRGESAGVPAPASPSSAPSPPQAPTLRAAAVNEPEHYRFLYSGMGPGSGNTVFGIGGRAFVLVPMVDVQVVHGLTDAFDLEVRAASVGLLNQLDGGARFRLIGNESISASVRADASAIAYAFNVGKTGAGVIAAVTPGVVFSFGGSSAQLTLGLDVPLFFAGVQRLPDASLGDVLLPRLRPNIAAEFAVDRSIGLFAQAQLLVSNKGTITFPTIAVGIAW
jgi:hypothetical protein